MASSFFGNDELYDQLVAARHGEREALERVLALTAELKEARDNLDENAKRSLAWEMSPRPPYLEIKLSLDPVILKGAYDSRHAFEYACSDAFRALWETFRGKPTRRPPEDETR